MGRGGKGGLSANDILFGDGVPIRDRRVLVDAPSDRRAKRAAKAVLWNSDGEDPLTDLTDTIANLYHWSDRYNVHTEAALRRAQDYHDADVAEEGPPACRVEPYESIGGAVAPSCPDAAPNEHRADLAARAIADCADPGDPFTTLADTFSDLIHFADRYGVDFDLAAQRGYDAYAGDRADDPPVERAGFRDDGPALDENGACSECGYAPARCRCPGRHEPFAR